MNGAAKNSPNDLLRIEDLGISFAIVGGPVHAVRNANFRVLPGKVTALVGESGSGKSVISQAVMGILPNSARVRGSILFNDPKTGKSTGTCSSARRQDRELRGSASTRTPRSDDLAVAACTPIGNPIDNAPHPFRPRLGRDQGAPSRCWASSAFPIRPAPTPCIRSSFPAVRQRAMIAMALLAALPC